MLLQKTDSLPLLRAGKLFKGHLLSVSNLHKRHKNSYATIKNKPRSNSFIANELAWKGRKHSNTELFRRFSGMKIHIKISIGLQI